MTNFSECKTGFAPGLLLSKWNPGDGIGPVALRDSIATSIHVVKHTLRVCIFSDGIAEGAMPSPRKLHSGRAGEGQMALAQARIPAFFVMDIVFRGCVVTLVQVGKDVKFIFDDRVSSTSNNSAWDDMFWFMSKECGLKELAQRLSGEVLPAWGVVENGVLHTAGPCSIMCLRRGVEFSQGMDNWDLGRLENLLRQDGLDVDQYCASQEMIQRRIAWLSNGMPIETMPSLLEAGAMGKARAKNTTVEDPYRELLDVSVVGKARSLFGSLLRFGKGGAA